MSSWYFTLGQEWAGERSFFQISTYLPHWFPTFSVATEKYKAFGFLILCDQFAILGSFSWSSCFEISRWRALGGSTSIYRVGYPTTLSFCKHVFPDFFSFFCSFSSSYYLDHERPGLILIFYLFISVFSILGVILLILASNPSTELLIWGAVSRSSSILFQ